MNFFYECFEVNFFFTLIACKYEFVACSLSNVVILFLFDLSLYVVTLYRPPSYSSEQNNALIDFLNNFCSDKEVLVQGDFNLPSLRWDQPNLQSYYIYPLDLRFYDVFTTIGLTQIVSQGTFFPSGNVLDLCLVSFPDRVGSCNVLPPLPSSRHCPVLVNYVFQDLNTTISTNGQRDRIWTKGNYNLMSTCLQSVDWEHELCSLPANRQYSRLLNILFPLIEDFVPVSDINRKSSVPWSVNPPRRLERAKTEAWTHYKYVRSLKGRRHVDVQNAWAAFKMCNENIKSFSISSQIEYERNLASQFDVNPKLFHSYIKHRRVSRPSVGPLRLNGFLTDDPSLMADCFVRSFKSVYAIGVPDAPSAHQRCTSRVEDLILNRETVESLLSNLDPNSSMGGDGVHSRMLKMLAHELSTPFTLIFNTSLQTGVMPAEWLYSVVVPIYKKSFRYDPLNYRPISLTSVPCKILEKAIVTHLYAYLENNSLISSEQFGFRAGHSTVEQLLLTYDDITKMVDSGKTVDLMFFDYSKAFDTVCHAILLDKLQCIGIVGHLLTWIEMFLTNRSMRVKVAGVFSESVAVTSGVPQGSVLGPLLFLIYINFVVSDLSCYFKIFADDIKLYLAFDSVEDQAILSHQENINKLVNKSCSWGLNMNQDKCVVMRFAPRNSPVPFTGVSPYQINGVFLKFVESHTDLGVTVDRSLKFHSHIRRRTAMVGNLTTNLLSCTLSRDSEFLMNIYCMHVRPILEYASPVWNLGYITDTVLLERIQRRWTKAIAGMSDLPYSQRLERLDLFSFKGRLLRADLILLWKILHGHSAICAETLFQRPPTSHTRGHPLKLYIPRCRLEVRKRFFSLRLLSTWNSLSPATVQADTINKFKSLLKDELGPLLFQYD